MFTPEKLTTTLLPPTTVFGPLDNRTYTLTHSDETGDLFLYIGCKVYNNVIDQDKRDEVVGKWDRQLGLYQLNIYVYITNGEFTFEESRIRYEIFQKELSLALRAMMYGDYSFFVHCPWLLDAPIVTHFQSSIPVFQQTNMMGRVRDYLV
ncbi:staygreen family protein [Mangrovibacillus cuniculi]|uniref:Staygreen protein domain-containing protein n=1 Tax=Mangrovibacillus cuniculi TaxID=2593652 RepID=A0A7S8CAP7_9BACI|nr:staygreen family protein [Mangrovibacillus cuniculi]QPC46488.1 hypothetical protein G8O30_05665 [Mangrovibacillus cuniculi]